MDGMEIFKQDVCRAALECTRQSCCRVQWKEGILVL